MTVTNDSATNIGKIRTLIQDPVGEFFTDEEIENVFIGMQTDGDLRLAAADALDAIANNQVLLLKRIEIVGALDLDGPAVAEALREAAKSLRANALGLYGVDDQFDIIEMNVDAFTYRDLITNDWLRTVA